MTALVIKNLPDEVLARLKAQAKANHRSLTKEAIVVLSASVEGLDGVVGGPPTPTLAAQEPVPRYRAANGTPPTDRPAHALRTGPDESRPATDGREALRAALVRQTDGSYINVLGIDDESFFQSMEGLRGEFRTLDLPDFGDEAA